MTAAPLDFDVAHLSLSYPSRLGAPAAVIVNDVSFQLERGATLTLSGPSGSGKSSLLRCLNRLEEPTAGRIRFKGRDITSLDPLELRRRVALVPQKPVLFDGTVRDNLRMQPASATNDLSNPALALALHEVGLDAALLDRDGGTLSGGEKQRVTIARALLGNPDALLLDEPTASLDPLNAALVVTTVSALQRSRALTIVIVTHQLELVKPLGGAILTMAHGEMRAYERVEATMHTAPNLTPAALLPDTITPEVP